MPSISRPFDRWDKPGCTVFEDISDRLNHFWTCGILLMFAGIVCARQTIHSPISCWLPNNNKEGNRQYVHDLCWNSHVIRFPRNGEINLDNFESDVEQHLPIVYSKSTFSNTEGRANERSTLYQWIPVLLTFQALLFKCPHLFLTSLHGYSGLSFNKLVALTTGYKRLNIAERRVLGNQIARYLYNWCDNFGHCIPWRFLTLVYVLTKFLFCINVIVQVCLLDAFLQNQGSNKSTSFSDVIIENIFNREKPKWRASQTFPHKVLCEFESPNSGDISKVRCVISMNVFNEKVFAIIWVWFLFVSTVTCTSLVSCLVKISVGFFRKRYIKKSLALGENKEDSLHDSSDIAKFADWIGEDCIMAFKLIGTNSSEILVSDIVCSMWKKRKRYKASNRAGYIDMTSGSHTSPPRIKIHPVVTDMEN